MSLRDWQKDVYRIFVGSTEEKKAEMNQNGLYPHSEALFSPWKEENSDTCFNIDEF